MSNSIEVTISDRSEVEVTHTKYTRGNYTTIKFENIELTIPEKVSKELQELHEKAVVAEEYWHETMQKEQDRLESEVEDLKELLRQYGYEAAS